MHFRDNITSTDEFTIDEKLRECWPVWVHLHLFSNNFIFQDVDALVILDFYAIQKENEISLCFIFQKVLHLGTFYAYFLQIITVELEGLHKEIRKSTARLFWISLHEETDFVASYPLFFQQNKEKNYKNYQFNRWRVSLLIWLIQVLAHRRCYLHQSLLLFSLIGNLHENHFLRRKS